MAEIKTKIVPLHQMSHLLLSVVTINLPGRFWTGWRWNKLTGNVIECLWCEKEKMKEKDISKVKELLPRSMVTLLIFTGLGNIVYILTEWAICFTHLPCVPSQVHVHYKNTIQFFQYMGIRNYCKSQVHTSFYLKKGSIATCKQRQSKQ